jgi:hypothetical protein
LFRQPLFCEVSTRCLGEGGHVVTMLLSITLSFVEKTAANIRKMRKLIIFNLLEKPI